MYTINQKSRNKVFYLLKKYTSYALLKKVMLLNKEFVDAFERQLRHPSDLIINNITDNDQLRHEQEFLGFLDGLNHLENILKRLFFSSNKKEIYHLIFEVNGGSLFDRYADEMGLKNDIFYKTLGLGHSHGYIYDPYDHTSYVEKMLFSGEILNLTVITMLGGEYFFPNKHIIYNKWSYESLFSESYWPLIKEIVEPTTPCPAYNESSKEQIPSGEEIQISGIYEPWFDEPVYKKLTQDPEYNVYVGCPNYFLEGSEATQYKLEGTDDWYDVKWHLIWEDNRYVDGVIPEEESAYTFDLDIKTLSNISENNHEKLSIRAREKVPQAGYWYTTAKETSRQYFKQGDIFPDVESDWGEVYWYFDGE